jgi:hypothetical protein
MRLMSSLIFTPLVLLVGCAIHFAAPPHAWTFIAREWYLQFYVAPHLAGA